MMIDYLFAIHSGSPCDVCDQLASYIEMRL